MNVIFGAYRDWGLDVVEELRRHSKISSYVIVHSLAELEALVLSSKPGDYDMVLLCGWSWQVSKELLAKIPVYSEHPCERDEYSLGTPLQGQISDGIEQTKHRIVKIGHPELIDRQYAHEVDMPLSGNMDEILENCRATAIKIYSMFLDDYPNIDWKTWPATTSGYRTPRKPQDGRFLPFDFARMSAKQVYDKIRMLEDPYPNAFLEDDDGIVYFTGAKYISKR